MQGDVESAGVHAWKTKSGALEYGSGAAYGESVIVVGRVDLWGEVVEHEIGYRAQFGRVASLDLVLDGEAVTFGKVGRLLRRRRETREEFCERILQAARAKYLPRVA